MKKKHLVLVMHPERMHPELAQFATLEGDYTILVTDLSLVDDCVKSRCDDATFYYLKSANDDPHVVWDEAKRGLEALKNMSCAPEQFLIVPWAHDSERAITGEAMLIERLQDVLPEVPGGVALLNEMFQRQLPIFTGMRA